MVLLHHGPCAKHQSQTEPKRQSNHPKNVKRENVPDSSPEAWDVVLEKISYECFNCLLDGRKFLKYEVIKTQQLFHEFKYTREKYLWMILYLFQSAKELG